MASVTGRAAGFIAKLYYVETVISDKSETNLVAAAIAANQVIDTSDMGELSKERDIIDIPVYGQDTAGSLPGQVASSTFDFSVTMNFDNTIHTTIRDDGATVEHTLIVEFTQVAGSNVTYAAFDGFIGNASVNQPIDGAITMDCSLARSGAVTWVDIA